MRFKFCALLVALLCSGLSAAAAAEDVGAAIESTKPVSDLTLLGFVVTGQLARTRPLLDYCEAEHASDLDALKSAHADYVATLRQLTGEIFEQHQLDPDLALPGNTREFAQRIARHCLADAKRYPPAGYCHALLDSYRQADRAGVRERLEGLALIVNGLAHSQRITLTDSLGGKDDGDARDCGPAHIATETLPLR